MDFFQQRAHERAQERQELRQVAEELKSTKIKVALLDDPKEIVTQAKRETRVSPGHLRRWGFDPRNPQHRAAWRQRNDPL